MFKEAIDYFNDTLTALGFFNDVLCLAEKIEREGQVYPAQCLGSEYKRIELDKQGSLSYWRKNGDITISEEENTTKANGVQYRGVIPLKLVGFIKKDSPYNDSYFADSIIGEIISNLTTSNSALKVFFKAKSATLSATKYVTDGRTVASEEYDNVNFEPRYSHAYFSIDFNLTIVTNQNCFSSICSGLPVDKCELMVIRINNLSPADKECVIDSICPGGGDPVTVQNSGGSYSVEVQDGDTLVLPDNTYNVYVNSVFNQTDSGPSIENTTINIS